MYVTIENAKKMVKLLSSYQEVASVEEYVDMLIHCRNEVGRNIYYDQNIYQDFRTYYIWMRAIYGEPFKVWAEQVYDI